jgi:hypothetical protein
MTNTPTQFTVAEAISTVCFVYPFLHTEHQRFAQRVAAVNARRWSDAPDAAPLWRTKNYAEVDDLLPYVAKYLTPMTEHGRAGVMPTAQFWTLNIKEQHNGKVRWAAPRAEGTVEVVGRNTGAVEHHWRFNVDEIQLALFGHGVGFLALWVTPRNVPSVEAWMSFVHYFRTPGERGGRRTRISLWRLPAHNAKTRYGLVPPNIELADDADLSFTTLRDALLRTASHDDHSSAAPWWKDAYVRDQLLPYALYFVDSAAPVPTHEMMTTLFKIRKFFAGTQDVLPTDADLDPAHPTLLQYARHMWFSFSLNGAAFTAFNAPPFSVYRNALAKRSLPEAYFLLFLLALQQRFTLMMLSETVAEEWLPTLRQRGRARRESFENIREVFLAFTARGYFAQVIQGERHHNYYRHWQEVFQVQQLYEEVRDALQQMGDHLELLETRQLNEAVQFLTAFSIILATVATLGTWWSVNFDSMPQPAWPWNWPVPFIVLNIVAIAVVVATTLFFWWKRWIFQRRKRPQDRL